MDMTLKTNCEFCKECPFFDPEFEKISSGDKEGTWLNCYHKTYCANAIHMYLQKQESKAKQTDTASSSWFNFIDDSREKHGQ